jgi:GntR family transcriptional regulator
LVEGRQGSGTFVRNRRPGVQIVRHWHEGLGYTMPYTAAMAARPDTNPAWTVDTDTNVEAPSVIAARLGIEAGARCVRSVYVFRMNDAVVMLYTSWEPHALTGGTPILLPERGPLAGAGVPTRMTEIGYPVVRAVERLSARPALASEAVALEVPTGTSLLVVAREWWTADRPVETADILIPGPNEVQYDLPTGR